VNPHSPSKRSSPGLSALESLNFFMADMQAGTGRVNVGQGAVMTAQGLGAALSPAIGGWIAEGIGYSAAFVILGCFAIGAIGLWLAFSASLKPAGGEMARRIYPDSAGAAS
jgi:MFS family permease